MSVLDSLWPSEASLNDTLGSDAHSLDRAVFLAVHQPMVFRRVPYGKTSIGAPVVRESDLLDALLADNGEGRVIVPIAGSSGAGKSHVIRWLEAELTSRADHDTRHVILVPKSSSLRSVLKEILRDLKGPRYEEIRKTLEGASERLPEVAAKDLRTRLVSVLKEKADAATERLRSRSSEDTRADEQAAWGRELGALLEDTELWNRHLYGDEASPTGVVARLAERVTSEGNAGRRYQFEAADLDNLTTLVDARDLSPGARAPIRRLADKRWQQVAADVMNGALDRATQLLLDLGGTSLSEVFLDIRRALLSDGKELVILVEDFAVLSGMQGALQDALIQEARVKGRREFCTIRSALAYTQGYQAMKDRDSVMTRAGAEWLIEDAPGSDEELLDRSVQLVGAYWNAARWGVAKLQEHQKRSGDRQRAVPIYEPKTLGEDEARQVEAFGRSRDGYPLFPLNAAAIQQLVREHSVVNGHFVFNPRLIIDAVVFGVAKLRRHFEKGIFPPRSLGKTRITAADVIGVINRQTPDQADRLLTLVTYWADCPDALGEAARLPGVVYETFGLTPLDFGSPAPPPSTRQRSEQPELAATSASDPFDQDWKPALDEWQRGSVLVQDRARNLRTWIAQAVVDTLTPDWPGSRPFVERTALAKDHVYLPVARGAGGLEAATAAISLCTDDAWLDPLRAAPIRQGLEAIIRFHGIDKTRGTWNYPGGDIHAVRYATFVATRRLSLIEWFSKHRESRQKQEDFSLSHLVEARLTAASVLGVGVKGGNQLESAIDVLFKELPKPEPLNSFPEEWRRLLVEGEQHGAIRNAERCRDDLIERVAARQGATGSKVLGIDIASLHAPVREFLKTWRFSDGPKDHASFASTVQRGVKARQAELREWYTTNMDWLGEAFDKHSLIEETRELLTEARQSGLARVEDIEAVRTLLTQFRDAAVTDVVNNAQVALRAPVDGTALTALAHHDARVAQIVSDLGRYLERVFGEIDGEINAKLGANSDRLVKNMVAQVAGEFTAVQATLDLYAKVGGL